MYRSQQIQINSTTHRPPESHHKSQKSEDAHGNKKEKAADLLVALLGEVKYMHVGGMASKLQDVKDAGELYHFGPEIFPSTLVLQVTESLKQNMHKVRQDHHKVQKVERTP